MDVLYAAGVRHFEFGNEIEDPPPDPYFADYFDLLRIASPKIRAKGADAVVILSSTLGPGADQLAFLEAATAEGDIWGMVDGAALHPYDNSVGNVITKITDARAAGRIPATKDIYITEIGWGTDDGSGGFTGTEAEVAARIRALFDQLTPTFKTTNRIKLICYFVYADYLTSGGNWDNFAGLLRRDGTRKPSWAALQEKAGDPRNWRYKDGGGRTGVVGAKAALDSFGEGTVAAGGTAPEVVTSSPGAVTQTSAQLRGTVDPNSLSTQWHYQYSLNPLPPPP